MLVSDMTRFLRCKLTEIRLSAGCNQLKTNSRTLEIKIFSQITKIHCTATFFTFNRYCMSITFDNSKATWNVSWRIFWANWNATINIEIDLVVVWELIPWFSFGNFKWIETLQVLISNKNQSLSNATLLFHRKSIEAIPNNLLACVKIFFLNLVAASLFAQRIWQHRRNAFALLFCVSNSSNQCFFHSAVFCSSSFCFCAVSLSCSPNGREIF